MLIILSLFFRQSESDEGCIRSESPETTPSRNEHDNDCDAQCCQDTLEVFQVTDESILKKTKKVQGHSRQFCPDWYRSYPWLVLCTTRLKAYCAYCRYCNERDLLTDKLGEAAFVTTGFNNWKKALQRFEQHSQSSLHKEAVLKLELLKQPDVVAQLNTQHKKDQQVRREMLLTTLSSLRFLLRQGLAIRGHEEMEGNLMQLLLLQAEHCSDLKKYIIDKHYLSNDIINEMTMLMSNAVVRQLLSEIREVAMFSLIADEATDVGHKEQLCVTIRWVDNSLQIHETPLELIHVPKTDSETLTSVIKDCLIRLALPIGQCRGQAYDGAANMSGHIRGVAARIQQSEPTAVFVHCLAHCTNLCLQSVGRQSLCVREALDLVMGLSQLIRFSPKRASLFAALQAQVSAGAPTLKPLCPTRWTVRTEAIQAVLANYHLLQEALELIQQGTDEYAMKAVGYLNSMEKFSTYFGLKLSHLVFSATEQLSLTLQGRDTTIQEAVQASKLAVHFIERQRTDEAYDSFYTQVVAECKDITAEPALPRQRRPPRRLDSGATPHIFDNPKFYFRKHYFEVLDIISGELKHRFQQERGMPVAAALEKTLLDAAQNCFDALPSEIEMYNKDIDKQRLAIQLKMLPDLVRTYNERNPVTAIKKVTTLRTLCEIMNDVTSSKTMFSEVLTLLHIVLTIPVTSATAERAFSALRRLKTFLRSSMSQVRLNHVMLLHIYKERTDKLRLLDVANCFISVNDWRKSFFGSF